MDDPVRCTSPAVHALQSDTLDAVVFGVIIKTASTKALSRSSLNARAVERADDLGVRIVEVVSISVTCAEGPQLRLESG